MLGKAATAPSGLQQPHRGQLLEESALQSVREMCEALRLHDRLNSGSDLKRHLAVALPAAKFITMLRMYSACGSLLSTPSSTWSTSQQFSTPQPMSFFELF